MTNKQDPNAYKQFTTDINSLILEILPIIEKVAEHTTKDRDERHEIKQELILKCYANEEKVRKAVSEKWIKNFLYLCARNLRTDAERNQSKKPISIDNVLLFVDITDEGYDLNKESNRIKVKGLKDLLSKIEGRDRLIVETYIAHDMNALKTSKEVGCDRGALHENLKRIYKLWKQSDIYLPL